MKERKVSSATDTPTAPSARVGSPSAPPAGLGAAHEATEPPGVMDDAYEALVRASPHCMYELDAEGRLASINPAGLRLLGVREPSAVLGRTLQSLVDPAEAARIALMVERAASGRSTQFDFTGAFGGQRRTFSSTLVPVRGGDGRVARLIGQTQDITELLRAETAAQESEARFYQAFQSAPCLMIVSSLEDHRFIDVNDMFVEASGFGREEVLGGAFSEQVWEERELHEVILTRLHRGERVMSVLTRYLCRSGEVRDALVSAEPIRMDGEACAVWQALDVTERIRDEERRLDLESQLQQRQRLESLGLLAGGIAHDFNNLLGAILANTDLALRKTEQSEKGVALLERIRSATLHASELTSQMLAYSGRTRLEVRPVDLNELVQDMMRLLEVTLPKNAHFALHLMHALPPVRADAAQLRQVLMNLLTNAAEALEGQAGDIVVRTAAAFLDQGSLSRSLAGSAPAPGRYCLLAVSDTGCGMDAETKARIFDPFFTTKRDGRGLGLAAAIGIVGGHGGAMDIQTERGVGTTFSVWLPCDASLAPPAKAADFVSPPAPPVFVGEPPLLLVVDDDPRFLEAVVDMVASLGYRTLTASNGEEALDLFRANAEELSGVLLDVVMPDRDGWDVLHALRRIRREVSVVVMSGFVPEREEAQVDREAPEGFLQKPFMMSDLQRVLASVVRGRAPTKAEL